MWAEMYKPEIKNKRLIKPKPHFKRKILPKFSTLSQNNKKERKWQIL